MWDAFASNIIDELKVALPPKPTLDFLSPASGLGDKKIRFRLGNVSKSHPTAARHSLAVSPAGSR